MHVAARLSRAKRASLLVAQLEPGRESENHDPDIRATVRLECQTGPGESARTVWADPGHWHRGNGPGRLAA